MSLKRIIGRAGLVPALLLTFIAASAAIPATASAHPALLQSSPPPGLISPTKVESIQLAFSEPAVADGSRITVSEAAGPAIATGKIVSSSGGRTLTVKPAQKIGEGVYQVKWTALGVDGHAVSGDFGFGVAGKKGEAPDGAQALVALGSHGGRGDDSAAAESVVTVISRWLALLCASFMVGGFVLLFVLRRRLAAESSEQARERWRTLAGPLWNLILLAGIELVIAGATAGAGSSFDLDTLFASPSGKGAVIQLVLLAIASGALVALRKAPRRRDLAFLFGGVVVLVTQALTGHLQTVNDKLVNGALQLIHTGSAGIWLGGLLALLVVTRAGKGEKDVPLSESAKAFAPVAGGAFLATVITGVLAAFREVDHLYFLKHSSYGHIIIIKTALVVLAMVLAGITALRIRRGRPVSSGLVRGEAGLIVVVIVFASVLTALVPGRGQPLPAQRGTLLPGPAFATAVSDTGPLRVTLAPALKGQNSLSVVQEPPSGVRKPPPVAKTVSAKLFCTCAEKSGIDATLTRTEGSAWTTDVDLPEEGPWYARVTVDGKASSPLALAVGVPKAAGPGPLTVLTVADLSGESADRCRSHLLGLELGIGRLNALGGLDGGRKLTVYAVDDHGDPAKARELTEKAIEDTHPFAMAAPCGPAAAEGVKVAGEKRIPSIVADPAVPPVNAPLDFRLAGDPYAEGFALGQYVDKSAGPAAKSKNASYVSIPGDAANQRRLDGFRAALDGSQFKVVEVPESDLTSGPDRLRSLINQDNSGVTVIDGDPDQLKTVLGGLGDDDLGFVPGLVLTPESMFSEDFIEQTGALGRAGAVQGAVEVSPQSQTSISYTQTVPALYPGEQPSLDGLRGYLAGLALAEGVEDGTGSGDISGKLASPPPFADALLTPWRSDAPSAGSQRFNILKGTFLPATLIPQAAGGETKTGLYFSDGTWTGANGEPLGPPFEQPVPRLPS